MAVLRDGCPWDADQTHRSLVQYLIEETLEVVEAIESGDQTHLQEELGDLLLQVIFHSEIASEAESGFDLEDVARGIADKLVARHPHVFDPATGHVKLTEAPTDLYGSWEQRKAVEKGRTSALEGIPEQMSAVAKANKIISRARSRQVSVDLPVDPIGEAQAGQELLNVVARAQASGIDPDQALREAVRTLEAQIQETEGLIRVATRDASRSPGLG